MAVAKFEADVGDSIETVGGTLAQGTALTAGKIVALHYDDSVSDANLVAALRLVEAALLELGVPPDPGP